MLIPEKVLEYFNPVKKKFGMKKFIANSSCYVMCTAEPPGTLVILTDGEDVQEVTFNGSKVTENDDLPSPEHIITTIKSREQ